VTTGEGHHDTFTGAPGVCDSLLRAILLQCRIHLVREPQQSEFAEGGQVSESEIVAERGIHPSGGIHLSLAEAIPQGLGCQVDQLDLLCASQHGIRDRLLLHHAGDLANDIVEAFDVLDIDGRNHVDAGIQDRLYVLPAFAVLRARRVRVGELVHQGKLGFAGEKALEVHLVERDTTVVDRTTREDLEPLHQRQRGSATVSLHDGNDHVEAGIGKTSTLFQHRERLADARSGPEHDPEPSFRHGVIIPTSRARC